MKSVALALASLLASGAAAQALGGRVTAGSDLARIVPPAGARVEPYSNQGYELRFVDGAVEIRVDLRPLESRWPFSAPSLGDHSPGTDHRTDPLTRIARQATSGATTRYDAVAGILGWVGSNIEYQLDRELSQAPEQVLARRHGYCTGIARLTVALLDAVEIEAREVPGYRLEPQAGEARFGFHRWVEVYYPDRGWVFSDPVASHQFVPATYLRLGDERLEREPGRGVLLERRDELEEVDLAPSAPSRVRVRANDGERGSAALIVRLAGGESGEALLAGEGVTRTARIENGKGRFLGLAPGSYELKVSADGRLAGWKKLLFRAPVLAEVTIAVEPRASIALAVGGGMR